MSVKVEVLRPPTGAGPAHISEIVQEVEHESGDIVAKNDDGDLQVMGGGGTIALYAAGRWLSATVQP